LEPALSLYVNTVLRARDILLAEDIRVVGYDLYPNGVGALLISGEDRKRAFAVLTSEGIQFTTTPPNSTPPTILPRHVEQVALYDTRLRSNLVLRSLTSLPDGP
jgi:hypothetical protein